MNKNVFRINLTKWIFITLVSLLPTSAFSQIQNLSNGYKFLALGDSYTIGTSVPSDMRWPSQLVDSLGSRGILNDTLIYIAQAGWRTDQLLQSATNAGLANDFDIVSLLIGVNNQFQRRSISDYKRELILLLSFAKEKANQSYSNVLVLSIPDYAYTPFGQASIASAQISAEIDSFNLVKKQVCDSLGVTAINITGISRLGLLNPLLVANDGLHPSGNQYSLWVDKILNEVTAISKNEFFNEENLFYPNPVNDEIRFSEDVKSWKIFDLNSREVFNSEMKESLEAVQPGMYIIEMSLFSDGIARRKVTIN